MTVAQLLCPDKYLETVSLTLTSKQLQDLFLRRCQLHNLCQFFRPHRIFRAVRDSRLIGTLVWLLIRV